MEPLRTHALTHQRQDRLTVPGRRFRAHHGSVHARLSLSPVAARLSDRHSLRVVVGARRSPTRRHRRRRRRRPRDVARRRRSRGTRSWRPPPPAGRLVPSARSSRTRRPAPARRTAASLRSGSGPAATQTARIPYFDHSIAIVEAMFSRAARAADECAINGTPRRGLNPTKHTNPRRFGIIHRSATRFVRCHGASTFNRCTARKPFSPICSKGRRELSSGVVDEDVDRLRTARRPRRGSASTCSGSRTSQVIASTSRPAASSSAARGLDRLRPPAADRDARAGPGELSSRCSADARCRRRSRSRPGRQLASSASGDRNSSTMRAEYERSRA